MNKRGLIFCMGIFLLLFFSNLASAQFYDFYYGSPLERIAEATEPFVMFVLGGYETGEILLIKFLIFLLVLTIVKFSLGNVPGIGEDKKIVGILSVIISLMAARFMTTEALINFIWLPYGVLGVALSSFLPLVIFFFFIEGFANSFLRRVGWTFFGVIYLGLALFRWEEFVAYGYDFNLGWIYIAIFVISVLMFIFDTSIYRRVILTRIKKGGVSNIIKKHELQDEIRKIDDNLARPHLSSSEAKRLKDEKKRLERAIARIT